MKRLLNKLLTTALLMMTGQLLMADEVTTQLAMQSHGSGMVDYQQQVERNIQQLVGALDSRVQNYPQDYEARLLKGIAYLEAGQLVKAQQELEDLIRLAPDFHLAHLILADVMMSRVPVTYQGQSLLTKLQPAQTELLQQLRDEVRVRLDANLHAPGAGVIPRQLVTLGESVGTALVVDKSKHRLYVIERNGKGQAPRLVRDYYVSTGKLRGNKVERGDLRTPEGVYFVTSWIPDEKLPDKYGIGAFPVNYPNELDRRMGKTGYGIWLHGTDTGFYSRPPRDSEGCVVLTNKDLNLLKDVIKPGVTPVVIAEKIEWIDEQVWQKQRTELLAVIEDWRKDWESLDVDKYLSHYAEDFASGAYNWRSWAKRKRNVASAKQYQKIALKDISLFIYPSRASQGKDMVVARFFQDYRSNNFSNGISKRLYLARKGERWQILYEGS